MRLIFNEPAIASVSPGTPQLFHAMIRLSISDGTTADVTDDVQWALAPEFTGGSLWDLFPDRGSFAAGPSPISRTPNAIRASRIVGATRVEGSTSLAVEASP